MNFAIGNLRKVATAVVPRHPAQGIAVGFSLAILVGTLALALPIAKVGTGGATLLEALFTATSAVCVTGLTVVDTAVYWTPFGHAVILALIQLGGLGIMAFASLLGLLVARRMGLKSRIFAATETKSAGLGDVKAVLFNVVRMTIAVELIVAVGLAMRFGFGYGYPLGNSIWLGLFHAVSSFNNAGFALFSDNLIGFVGDPWIVLPISIAVILGGLGFPVLFEMGRRFRRPLHWSLNAKLVLSGTAVLLIFGTLFITVSEWSNPKTLGLLSNGDKILAGFFQSVVTRTAGFNSIDIAHMSPPTWLGMDFLMFVGGGPAGTAGGLKITTFTVLFFIVISEIRGDATVSVFGKSLVASVQRQAVTVILLAAALVSVTTFILMLITDIRSDQLLFEAVSAFGTVGLSTGITASLPVPGQLLLVFLMFVGRLGPVTLASALALRSRKILYEFPKERPLIG